ncbi:MAG: deoxyribonuclease IV [Kiritimatiellae bacterium]|nr:deoxyribonuclease IV [Kiritimatiellia bacterium]
MAEFKIGCHVSSSGGYMAMAQTAVSIGANVFQFFTRNPRGGAAKPIDKSDVEMFLEYASSNNIGPILAHAPYTLNGAGQEQRVRDFAETVMFDDLQRLELTPGAMYNFHPGSHVGQGAEKGMELVASMLIRILKKFGKVPSTTILLETMAGKGSELGASPKELSSIINAVESECPEVKLAICLDTCHVWDGGNDIVNNLDGVLDSFEQELGRNRIKAIHLNDSMNSLGAHKDRHQKIGKGFIGLEAFERIINSPRLSHLPFYLETPCDLQGYKEEIELLKSIRK